MLFVVSLLKSAGRDPDQARIWVYSCSAAVLHSADSLKQGCRPVSAGWQPYLPLLAISCQSPAHPGSQSHPGSLAGRRYTVSVRARSSQQDTAQASTPGVNCVVVFGPSRSHQLGCSACSHGPAGSGAPGDSCGDWSRSSRCNLDNASGQMWL